MIEDRPRTRARPSQPLRLEAEGADRERLRLPDWTLLLMAILLFGGLVAWLATRA